MHLANFKSRDRIVVVRWSPQLGQTQSSVCFLVNRSPQQRQVFTLAVQGFLPKPIHMGSLRPIWGRFFGQP